MNKIKVLSGSTLKIIAIVTMFLDHLGGVVLRNGIMMQVNYENLSDEQYAFIVQLYNKFHMIGRIAFPIFCFLAVEGFIYTHNLKKYIIRLLIFAAISEPIYNLALHNNIISFEAQNVLFTLTLGLLGLIVIRYFKDNWLAAVLIGAIASIISYYLHFDGQYYGIILMVIMYMFHKKEIIKYILLAAVMFICGLNFTLSGLLNPYFILSLSSVIFMILYNGKRGLNIKFIFYAFYPLHLLFLFLLGNYLIVPFLNK